jgi:type II secretory pathway predicted ATPase ExeA
VTQKEEKNMRVDVMQHYGLTQPFSQTGYFETELHKQLLKDIKGAIQEGRLIAVCGVVGSGKTVTMRRLQQQLKEENKVTVSKSLTVEKHSVKLTTLIAALFYDISTDKKVHIPKGEQRERELRDLVRKNKRPIALFVDEAHDLNGCDLNLKQPQQKERQKDLFFAKTVSIFEPLKLMPVNLKCQPHRVVSSAYRQDKTSVL